MSIGDGWSVDASNSRGIGDVKNVDDQPSSLSRRLEPLDKCPSLSWSLSELFGQVSKSSQQAIPGPWTFVHRRDEAIAEMSEPTNKYLSAMAGMWTLPTLPESVM